MGEPPIQNPHDGFFKQTFGQVEFTRDFLANFLPGDVAECLQLRSLEAANESFVDDELRQTHSDLTFTVNLVGGGEAVVYLLFEHKSHADRLAVFQLLKYVVRINERRLRDGLPLCCVIPLVVYHGATAWNVARSIDELVDVPPPLRRFLPRLSIELFDLSGYGDEELRGEAFLHASLLLLKYIFRPELPGELTRIFGLLSAMQHQAHGLDCIKLLLNYLIQGTDRVDADTLRTALQQGLQPRGEELMPTLAEQWTKQGRELGRQEGRQEGREEGEIIGKIQAFQEVLGLAVLSKEELLEVEIDKLRVTLDELRSRLSQR